MGVAMIWPKGYIENFDEIRRRMTILDPALARARQEDAAIVAAMAEQAIEDGDIIATLLDAGCAMDECAVAFSDGKVTN